MSIPLSALLIALPRLPIAFFPAAKLFKRIGRGNEIMDPERKGSRTNPRCFPPVGSVVYRELGPAEHSGVYIGGRLFVSKSSKGRIVAESLDDFLGRTLSHGLSGFAAAHLFVSAGNDRKPIGRQEIANRAKGALGKHHNHSTFESMDDGAYNLILNNCHIFTSYCVTGDKNEDIGLSDLKAKAKQAHMHTWIGWTFNSAWWLDL